MRFRKPTLVRSSVAFMVVAIIVGYFGFSLLDSKQGTRQAGIGQPEEESTTGPGEAGPVVRVKTVAVQQSTIKRDIIAYGVVIVAPEEIYHLSVPFEARVRTSRVTPGQLVARGEVLMEIEPSPATILQLKQAQSALETATKNLTQMRNRLELKLATTQELLAAERDWQAAQLQMESLNKMGIDISQIKADLPALVTSIPARAGLIVPAGNSLIDIAEQKHIEVKLNVEPTDVPNVQVDQLVEISSVHEKEGTPVKGRVRLVTMSVNPSSRMVDVFVRLPMKTRLLLKSFVRGRIVIGSKQALLVPRSAVLTDGDKYTLFTVRDGRAAVHTVTIGWEDDKRTEIVGDDIKEGMPVVVEGNCELKDGMAVITEQQS
jgi:membrane fusion protein (multidrug efflux system)